MAVAVRGQENYRTNINPALLYYQAALLAPNNSPEDRDYIFTNNWHARPMDERVGNLVSLYNHEFQHMRQAALSKVPCDWGIDDSPGPFTLLPGASRWSQAGRVARLRAAWELQHGEVTEAGNDLLAALTLGRYSSRDGYLISVLVQIAIENSVCQAVAENYFRWPPQALKELADGIEAAPPRGTVAESVTQKEMKMGDWMLRKIEYERRTHPGADVKILEDVVNLLEQAMEKPSGQRLPGITNAAGGSVDGLIKLANELPAYYQRVAQVVALPYPEFEKQAAKLHDEVEASPNPLVRLFIPGLDKARAKEDEILAKLAMVRAAAEYKLHGEAGAKKVLDPSGTGPFELQPFFFQGERRGIKLTSAFRGRGWPETLIFVEKDGPPFVLEGKNAGEPDPLPAAKP